jgi:hypothetical protein
MLVSVLTGSLPSILLGSVMAAWVPGTALWRILAATLVLPRGTLVM